MCIDLGVDSVPLFQSNDRFQCCPRRLISPDYHQFARLNCVRAVLEKVAAAVLYNAQLRME